MEKKKFYYDTETRIIDVEPFFNEQINQDKPYIELTFQEWEEKLSSCNYGYKKAYINNEIVEVEDSELMNSE